MSRTLRATRAAATAAALAALVPVTAYGGGLGRPNSTSARAIGWGGAFAAIADDPTALHFNPAGMARQPRDAILVGVEAILAPRSYTPLADDGSLGEEQAAIDEPEFLPVLGYVSRLPHDGVPSRWALGIGFWNTFGGSLEFERGDPNVKAVNATSIALLELVPGLAYEVNDVLQIGVAFRLGLGLFSVDATKRPTPTQVVSTSGVGAGFSAGLMFAPSQTVRLGLVWRSSIDVSTKGDGEIDFGDGRGPRPVEATMDQTWPQQAALGVHWQATRNLGLAVQADWTDWSDLQRLIVLASGASDVNELDFDDGYAAHLGAELALSDVMAVRGGYTFETSSVPDRTIDRTFLDADKHAGAVGMSYAFKDWVSLDAAFETVIYPRREVPDNSDAYVMFPDRANIAPGEYEGQIFTLELGVQFKY